MKIVVQKVNYAILRINKEIFSRIDKGFLVLFCVEQGDTLKDMEYFKNKVCNLRIFEDENDKMNLSIKDVNGEMMVVSQFTLCGSCTHGNRPSFINAEKPELANEMYKKFVNDIRKEGINVVTGKFGEYMKIEFENDGPVTIILDSRDIK